MLISETQVSCASEGKMPAFRAMAMALLAISLQAMSRASRRSHISPHDGGPLSFLPSRTLDTSYIQKRHALDAAQLTLRQRVAVAAAVPSEPPIASSASWAPLRDIAAARGH